MKPQLTSFYRYGLRFYILPKDVSCMAEFTPTPIMAQKRILHTIGVGGKYAVDGYSKNARLHTEKGRHKGNERVSYRVYAGFWEAQAYLQGRKKPGAKVCERVRALCSR